MTWKRGLFRLWLVLSLGWIEWIGNLATDAFCDTYLPREIRLSDAEEKACIARGGIVRDGIVQGAITNLDCLPRHFSPPERRKDCSLSPSGGFVRDWGHIAGLAEDALWPPVVAFLSGCVLLWVIGGFRRQSNRV